MEHNIFIGLLVLGFFIDLFFHIDKKDSAPFLSILGMSAIRYQLGVVYLYIFYEVTLWEAVGLVLALPISIAFFYHKLT